MNSIPLPEPHFLEEDPTPDRLQQAFIMNMRAWLLLLAENSGGQIHQEQGLIWTYTSAWGGRGALAFPQLDPIQTDEQLDTIIEFYRHCHPLQEVMYWSMAPARPADLETQLLARGFEWNWRPHWMWLDFRHMRTNHARPSELRIEIVQDEPDWEIDDLPYYSREDPSLPYTQTNPQLIWHFAARLRDQVVGHCTLLLTTGEMGIAGIFSMGVVPSARNQGIGKALVLVACQFAQERGYHHAALNATGLGEPMYRRVGFVSLGYGYTWLLRGQTLAAPPPTRPQIAFIEAIGRGDTDMLDEVSKHLQDNSFNAPLASDITPLQIAVKLQQPRSATWLIEHGTPLDVLSAWDLGWKNHVPELLAKSPHLANERSGPWQLTPLQIAAQRGDIALARVLLTAHPDLDLRDAEFHGTALSWAKHFQRTKIIELIETYLGRMKPS